MNAKLRGQHNATLARIRALNPHSDNIDVFGPAVLAAFAGVDREVFIAIDNAIGNARADVDDKGWMVRRVRNHPDYGRKLFAGLSK